MRAGIGRGVAVGAVSTSATAVSTGGTSGVGTSAAS